MKVTQELLKEVMDHAAIAAPGECCGLVIQIKHKWKYIPCRNISEDVNNFIIHPDDYTDALDRGNLLMVVHSHYGVPPIPSDADRVGCEHTGVPWLIVNYPTGSHHVIKPEGYRAPLIGRDYCFGVLDCWTLVRDYYEQTLNITLPNFEYEEEWWLKGKNEYVDNYEKAGFYPVPASDIRLHDFILMYFDSSVMNHAGVYLGKHHVGVYAGNSEFLHHPYKALSCRRPYGGYWQKHTGLVLRHRSNPK